MKNYLENFGTVDVNLTSIEVKLIGLLKIPLLMFLAGNVLFAVLLVLRLRVLSDQFQSEENRLLKIAVLVYVCLTIIGSLLSLLFVSFS